MDDFVWSCLKDKTSAEISETAKFAESGKEKAKLLSSQSGIHTKPVSAHDTLLIARHRNNQSGGFCLP